MLTLLVTIIVVLIIAGLAIWLLSFLPLDAKIAQLIRGLIIVCAVLYVIYALWQVARPHLP